MNFRIATWNLERPRASAAAAAKHDGLREKLKTVNADVWLFTESSKLISPGEGYYEAHSNHIENYFGHTEGEVRSSIWSRYPILQQIETHDPDTAVCVELDSPVGPLIVYSTIIPYHGAGTNYGYRYMGEAIEGLRAWELHSQAIETHAADWQRIMAKFPESHFCVGGDFNQNRDGQRWYGTKAVREQMTTVFETTRLKCLTEEDFRASGKLETKSSVDHICLDHALAGKVTYVGAWEAGTHSNGKRLSDHNGVWLQIEIPDAVADT